MSDLPPNNLRIEPATAPPKAKDTPPRQNKSTEINLIIASLEKSYSFAGMALMMVNPADAQIIASNAGDLAESWRSLLETNPKVRKSFMKMMESSGWSSVIFAHLMVAAPIFKNHKDSFEHLTNKARSKNVRSDRVAEPTATPTS